MNYLTSYINSDYSIDDYYQGYFRLDKQANLGRLVSLIDITSQTGKAVIGTTFSAGISIGRIAAGAASLLIVIPSTLFWGVAGLIDGDNSDYFKDKTVTFIQFGAKNIAQGFCTAVIGIPLSLIWRVFMVMADTIGIFLPEVGRWARNLNKLLNTCLALLLKNKDPIEAQKTEPVHVHRYSHPQTQQSASPLADQIGELTIHKALEILGLKEGATLAEVNKKARALLREQHPDRGGDPEAFKETRRAQDQLCALLN